MKYLIFLLLFSGCSSVEKSQCDWEDNKIEVCATFRLVSGEESMCNCVNRSDYWEFIDHQRDQ